MTVKSTKIPNADYISKYSDIKLRKLINSLNRQVYIVLTKK